MLSLTHTLSLSLSITHTHTQIHKRKGGEFLSHTLFLPHYATGSMLLLVFFSFICVAQRFSSSKCKLRKGEEVVVGVVGVGVGDSNST